MTPVWHVAWKEYRALRGFWLAIVAIVVVVQWCVKLALVNPNQPDLLFSLVIWLPAFYALGCGATTFAAEKDDGTFEWLRTIPVDGFRVLAGKLLYAVPSTLALFAAVTLLSRWIAGEQTSSSVYQQVVLLWGTAAVEALAWGMLISLCTRKPLQSVVIAAAIGSTVTHLTVMLFVSKDWTIDAYLQATPYRLGIAGIVLLADIALARNWLSAGPSERRHPLGRQLWVRERAASRETTARPALMSRLGRLWWQEWRASRFIVLAYAGVSGLACVGYFIASQGGSSYWNSVLAATLTCGVTTALLGASTFRADHENQHFRFFADHSINAREVWWARQSFWLLASLACGLTAYAVTHLLGWSLGFSIAKDAPGTGIPDIFESGPATVVTLCLLVPFAASQFASALLRSPLLAATSGLALSALLLFWCGVAFGTSMAWWWSVAPLIIALFAASRLRVSHWLAERNDWRAWAKVWSTLFMPAVAVMALAIAFRIYEVPNTVNGVSLAGEPFDVAAFTAPWTESEKQTAFLYMTVSLPDSEELNDLQHAQNEKGLKGSQLERQVFLAKHEDAIELILSASARRVSPLFDPRNPQLFPLAVGRGGYYATLLIESGRDQEARGNLTAALDRYESGYRFARQLSCRAGYVQAWHAVLILQRLDAELLRWAEEPGQTRELLERAVEVRRKAGHFTAYFEDAPKVTYVAFSRALERGETLVWSGPLATLDIPINTATPFPWERARRQRLLKLITYVALHGTSTELETPWRLLRSNLQASSPPDVLTQLTRGGPLEPLLGQSALPPNMDLPDMYAVIKKIEVRRDALDASSG